jgi:hypothetical protein
VWRSQNEKVRPCSLMHMQHIGRSNVGCGPGTATGHGWVGPWVWMTCPPFRRCPPTRITPSAAVSPLPRDQLPVPPKNGVGRHERRDLVQQPAPQAVAEFCEAPTLVFVETQPLSAKTDLQHAILFAEKRDHVLVFTLVPSAQQCQEELERRHGPQSTSEVVDR